MNIIYACRERKKKVTEVCFVVLLLRTICVFTFLSVPKTRREIIMNSNEIRSSHPSSAQVETLVEFMEGNPGLAKGFLRTQNARERSRRQWEELAVRLNNIGGTIKNHKQWTKVTNTPSPPHQRPHTQDAGAENDSGTQELHLAPPTEEPLVNVILGSEQIDSQQQPSNSFARRLFGTSSSSSVGASQSIVDCQLEQTSLDPRTYHPSLSPPPITLTHTPTPSPSRRGSTQGSSPAVRRRVAVSTSQRQATPIASPSRRPRIRMVRGDRGVGSESSRQTSSSALPPSQRRTEFSTFTERFLRVEEQQLEIQRSNARILQSFLERSAERERVLAEAVTAVGKGLQAVAEALNRDRV